MKNAFTSARSSRLAAEQFSDLIGAIYDCAIDPQLWPQTIGMIAEAVGCFGGLIGVTDLKRGQAQHLHPWGYPPSFVESLPPHTPDVIAAYRSVPDLAELIDEPRTASRTLPPEFFETSPYIQELRTKYGIVDSLNLFLLVEPDRVAELALSRHESLGVIADRDIDVLRLLAPHIRRAVTIGDLIDMRHLEVQALGATLDSVAVGVVIVGHEGRILHSNEPARQMLARGSPIRSSGGRLSALQPDVTKELMRAIALAQANETGIGKIGIGVPLTDHAMTVATAHVLPLARGQRRTRLMPQATAAVFVSPVDAPLPNDFSTIGRIFALTAAETRLLTRLAEGTSLAGTAAALGITLATAKTHRTHLFAKMGIRRRTELSAILARLVPPIQQRAR
jgi:DNA-binding CsgD family transcriptional regulator/PAS domain-containing protein